MTKKRILLLILTTLFLSVHSFSQQKKLNQLPSFDKYELHWGFYLGFNSSNYKLSYQKSDFQNTSIQIDSKIGFNIGLIADMKIDNHFNLRLEPGLISNANTINFIDGSGNDVFGSFTSTNIESTYLHIPLLLKYSALRLNNVKPYLIGGLSYDYNFSSNQESDEDNSSGQFRTKSFNFMYEVGFGFDIYFHYFKFSPSIRGQFAVTNELHRDKRTVGGSPWTDPIELMESRSVFIKLAFE